MAVFEHAQVAPFGARTVLKAVELCERVIEEIRVTYHAQRVHSSLKSLSASQLSDIGLGERDLMSQSRDMARRAL